MLLNYLNLWLYKQIPCHSFRIPTLKVIKSENFNIFCFTIFVYNSYTKGCKIHPRITTFYGIIFSPVFCRNFLPKPSEFCCTKKGQFLHHDGICRYLYHYTLFRQNFPPPGSLSDYGWIRMKEQLNFAYSRSIQLRMRPSQTGQSLYHPAK